MINLPPKQVLARLRSKSSKKRKSYKFFSKTGDGIFFSLGYDGKVLPFKPINDKNIDGDNTPKAKLSDLFKKKPCIANATNNT